jgi:lipopolysaccharide/colanic/teichoic acid biosynthesis glycosyltransferase
MAKRLFDIAVAAAGLVVLGPLLLAIALLVRADSPGPALFRQVRVGRDGRPFRILKFRTMAQAAGAPPSPITVGRDPRITRLGAVLRAWKLDELPQLMNVLAGDMSLVGPRPELPDYVGTYPPATRRIVLSVRPGITDPASLAYRDEAALLAAVADPLAHYRDVILPRKLALNVAYVRERSFAGDLRLIAQTVAALFERGAPPAS